MSHTRRLGAPSHERRTRLRLNNIHSFFYLFVCVFCVVLVKKKLSFLVWVFRQGELNLALERAHSSNIPRLTICFSYS